MTKFDIVRNFLLLEIERIELKLKEAEKKRKKHLFMEDIGRLQYYTEIYNFINNLL